MSTGSLVLLPTTTTSSSRRPSSKVLHSAITYYTSGGGASGKLFCIQETKQKKLRLMCPDKSREKNKSRCPKKTYTHTRTYYTDTLWRAYDVVV